MKTLVTGGVRSGKSAHAEALLHAAPGVTYVATGPARDDADWAARVAEHQARRPASWRTLETTRLDVALVALRGPALVDCLGTWLTAQLDELGAWDASPQDWGGTLAERIDSLVLAWQLCPHDVVAVTNEVGWGVVPEHRSGRLFADWLGRVNQRLAAVSDRVVLVVAGIPVPVKG